MPFGCIFHTAKASPDPTSHFIFEGNFAGDGVLLCPSGYTLHHGEWTACIYTTINRCSTYTMIGYSPLFAKGGIFGSAMEIPYIFEFILQNEKRLCTSSQQKGGLNPLL